MANETLLANGYNPEVMADMISAQLTSKIQLSPLAKIDRTLVATAGNTITVPKYAYIGEAADLAENTAGALTQMTVSHTHATVKKAFKAVLMSDELLLSGYGNPMDEAQRQLTMSIADKIDSDCFTALGGIAAGMTYDATNNVIGWDEIVLAVAKFASEDFGEDMYLIIHPNQYPSLLADTDFVAATALGDRIKETGVLGMIGGCKVIKSNKIAIATGQYVNYIVKPGALTIYLKRDVNIEDDRDIMAKTTTIAADTHYVAVLSDATKAVKFLTDDNIA